MLGGRIFETRFIIVLRHDTGERDEVTQFVEASTVARTKLHQAGAEHADDEGNTEERHGGDHLVGIADRDVVVGLDEEQVVREDCASRRHDRRPEPSEQGHEDHGDDEHEDRHPTVIDPERNHHCSRRHREHDREDVRDDSSSAWNTGPICGLDGLQPTATLEVRSSRFVHVNHPVPRSS